ncbi:cilia- and flagella-associated protein 77 [Centropristis striata]|uniref:cilia- and flagella-associated protein 77 n=1 Tax=Centropristis striata TaxID=184440 RepID=UPI0027DF3001|nr:cilia- and flagella-associated protein 77 [Centropristis striata]
MSSPRLGVFRDSMTTNPLIIKAPLGQSQSRGLSFPGPDFTFGTSSGCRDGGVAEVLSSWSIPRRRGESAPLQPLPPDFVTLNRDAVRSGLVTSKELSQYRAQRGEANKSTAHRQREGGALLRPAVPDITFGVTTRAPSPLADLLSHQYARRWTDEQLRRNQTAERHKLQRIRPGYIVDTRTSLLRRSRPLPVIHTPLTLPRFTQVAPALDTFRDPEARRRALRARQAVDVSRRDVQDQGTDGLD